MKTLAGKVALVTGASRGIGKGIALGLGEAGATVYVTGRTIEEGKAAVQLPGTIQQTAAEVTQLGGQAIAIRCDHRNDDEVEGLFQRIRIEQNRLDILVNNVWGGYEQFNDGTEFWKEKGVLDGSHLTLGQIISGWCSRPLCCQHICSSDDDCSTFRINREYLFFCGAKR